MRATSAIGQPEQRRPPHVMVIDDEPINIKLIRKVLQDADNFRLSDVIDPRIALSQIRKSEPDVILLDVMMPHISGLEILEAIRATPQFRRIPVIILTASTEPDLMLQALELGATDFLTKPVDRAELIPRVRNCADLKASYDAVAEHARRLEADVAARTEELTLSRLEIVECLARAAEISGGASAGHAVRVGRVAGIVARHLGFTPADAELILLAAQLHDVGVIGRTASTDADRNTALEEAVTARQCLLGRDLLCNSMNRQSHTQDDSDVPRRSPLLRMAARIALTHREHWDGTGGPTGLRGVEIPIEGRITAVADVFDDPLRNGRTPPVRFRERLDFIRRHSGSWFDPEVVAALTRSADELLALEIGNRTDESTDDERTADSADIDADLPDLPDGIDTGSELLTQ